MALATELRSKSESIRLRADQNRKVKTLDELHPLAVSLYVWWRKNSGATITRENYCHFYRVALFWAPLLYVEGQLARVAKKRSVQVTAAVALIAAIVAICVKFGVLFAVPILAGGVYIVVGITVVYRTSEIYGDRKRLLDKKQESLSLLGYLALATSPVYLTCHAIALFVRTSPVRWLRRNIENIFLGVLISAVAFCLIAVATIAIVGAGWLGFVQILGLITVASILCVFGANAISKIAKEVSSRSKVRKTMKREVVQRRGLEPVIVRLFELQYPQLQNQQQAYAKWRPRFDRFVEKHASWGVFAGYVGNGYSFYGIPQHDMITLQRFLITLQRETKEASAVRRTKLSSLWLVVSGVCVIVYHVIREAKTKTCALIDGVQSQQLIEQ